MILRVKSCIMLNMEKVIQKNCLILIRVSSTKQAQQGESIGDQRQICEVVAKRNNLDVLKVFSEQFSGRKKERPSAPPTGAILPPLRHLSVVFSVSCMP